MDSRTGLLQPVLRDGVAGGGPLQRHEPKAHEQLHPRDAGCAGLGSHELVRLVAGRDQQLRQGVRVLVAPGCVERDNGPQADVPQVGRVGQFGFVGLVEQALQHADGLHVPTEQTPDVADEPVGHSLFERTLGALEALICHENLGLDELALAVQPVGVVPLEVQLDGLRAVLALHHGASEVREAHDVVQVQVHGRHDGVGLREREVGQLVPLEPGVASIDTGLRPQRVELDVHGQGHVLRLERRVSDDRVGHFSHLGFLVGKVEALSGEKAYNNYAK